MATFNQEQKEKLNHFLKEKGLIHGLNEHLSANGLDDFEVESIKLRPRNQAPAPNTPCTGGKTWVEFCDENTCEWRCI